MEQTSILIGIPCLEHIKNQTVRALFASETHIQVPATLHIYNSSLIHDARNNIVKRAIEDGYSHVMFIDSDIVFPEDGIQKLLDQDKDVIGGLYFRKMPPHRPNISEIRGKELIFPSVWPKNRPFKVAGIGAGFLLVKTSVFKEIGEPWFYYGKFHDSYMGEDIYFGIKCKKRGIEVWCDPTIELQHIGEYAYDTKDYEAYHESKPASSVDEVWGSEV